MGLGSNVGRSEETLAAAVRELAAFVLALRVSPLYRTEPVGGPPQDDFVNAVVTGTTRLSPGELLAALQTVERAAGRTRTAARNTPRTLDLDLLLYGSREVATPDLTVPHPRLAERRFALAPLADLAPRRVVSGTGRTVRSLLAAAPGARVERI